MKQINPNTLIQRPSEQHAIFFTEDGKIILESDSPLLPLRETLDRWEWNVQGAYEDDVVLMVQVTSLEEEVETESAVKLMTPRDYFLSMSDQPEIGKKVLRAAHWAVASRMLQFCSHCAAPLEKVLETTEKKCPQCQRSFFPKLSPAVMVLVQRGEEILLARGPQHPPGIYTVLAGFIDLGESAEETVHREVQEEVGLEVTNLKYFGSQSWPFPDSFMMAFTADHLRGEIKIDPHELEEAHWFHRDQLPKLPPPSTLSRKLIEDFLMRTASPDELQAILWHQTLGEY
jgi:NADH pyrophosphatase NudC (nudix superfamily)